MPNTRPAGLRARCGTTASPIAESTFFRSGCQRWRRISQRSSGLTFRQALELDAHVRKGSLVVYANSITRTEHDEKSGEDVEREILYMKAFPVFNVEQIDGLSQIYHAKAAATLDPVARIEHAEKFLHATGAKIAPRRKPRLLQPRDRRRADAAV